MGFKPLINSNIISLKAIIISALILLAGLSYVIAFYSADIYHQLAIKNLKTSSESLITYTSQLLINDLQDTQKIFGYKLLTEKRFKKQLKNKDVAQLTSWLEQNFKRYYVTAGLIDLSSISINELSGEVIAEAHKTSDTYQCSTIKEKLSLVSGSNRLKPLYSLCLVDDNLYSEVVLPIGSLKLKGYLRIVTSVAFTLKKIESELNMPIQLLTPTKQLIYQSKQWSAITYDSSLPLVNYVLDDSKIPSITINSLYNLSSFDNDIRKTENQLILMTSLVIFFTLLATILYLKNAFKPLNGLQKSAQLITQGQYQNISEQNLPQELTKPVQAFNHMLTGLKEESNKRNQAEQLLRDEKDFIATTLNSINDAVIVVDIDGIIQFSNPASKAIFCCEPGDIIGYKLDKITQLYKDIEKAVLITVNEIIDDCSNKQEDISSLHIFNSQNVRTELEHSCTIMHKKDSAPYYVLIFKDITDDREFRRKLHFDAYHDNLTGLFNRYAFEERFNHAVSQNNEQQQHFIAYLDFDQFKVVNDICGHAAGDQLLKKLSQKFISSISKDDTFARLGGDEFGLILFNHSKQQAEEHLKKIITLIKDYRFVWNDKAFSIGVSIGYAEFGQENDQIDEFLSAVDAACYIAKNKGGNQFHFYHKDENLVAAHKISMDWVSGINKGLDEKRFILYAQPIKALNRTELKQHYEVLVRYQDEDNNIIPPGAFLSSAERFNLIEKIDLFVLNQTIQWLHLHQKSHPHVFLSVNLSGRSIGSTSFQKKLIRIIQNCNIDTTKLCFEITETAVIADVSNTIDFIHQVKAFGISFSIDDFGSGLSSFAYLKQFPVDYLKIDGMFIKDILSSPEDYTFVRAMAEVGHCLGMKIIAEFVESDKMLHLLREARVDYTQGWAIGKPKPIDSILSATPSQIKKKTA